MAKIFRSGNSKVVALPEKALREVGLAVGDEVEVEFAEDEIKILPAKKGFRADPEIHKLTKKLISEYRPALEELARR